MPLIADKAHVGVQNNYISLSESPQAYFSFSHLMSASRSKSNTGMSSGDFHGTAGGSVGR